MDIKPIAAWKELGHLQGRPSPGWREDVYGGHDVFFSGGNGHPNLTGRRYRRQRSVHAAATKTVALMYLVELNDHKMELLGFGVCECPESEAVDGLMGFVAECVLMQTIVNCWLMVNCCSLPISVPDICPESFSAKCHAVHPCASKASNAIVGHVPRQNILAEYSGDNLGMFTTVTDCRNDGMISPCSEAISANTYCIQRKQSLDEFPAMNDWYSHIDMVISTYVNPAFI
eukprot:s3131_g7.t2